MDKTQAEQKLLEMAKYIGYLPKCLDCSTKMPVNSEVKGTPAKVERVKVLDTNEEYLVLRVRCPECQMKMPQLISSDTIDLACASCGKGGCNNGEHSDQAIYSIFEKESETSICFCSEECEQRYFKRGLNGYKKVDPYE